jgi:hypothetical protein
MGPTREKPVKEFESPTREQEALPATTTKRASRERSLFLLQYLKSLVCNSTDTIIARKSSNKLPHTYSVSSLSKHRESPPCTSKSLARRTFQIFEILLQRDPSIHTTTIVAKHP